MDIFSTRERATTIWTLIFIIIFLKKKETRESIRDIINILFSKSIMFPFIIIMMYSSLLLFIGFKLDINSYINLKEVAIWLLFSGVPLCYSAALKTPNKDYYKEIINENIKFIILIEFIISTFTFSLITELIMIPFFMSLVILEAFTSREKEYEQINNIINYILGIVGTFILYKSFSLAMQNYRKLNFLESIVSIVIPIILSILYMPIVFLFGIWFNYDNLFFRVKTKLKFKFRVFKNNIKKDKRKKYNYKVEKIDDISNGVVKRKNIILILKEKYELKDIKKICVEQFALYNYKNDVVWIYVATNKENYIISNWIVQAQWINPKLDERFRPIPLNKVARDDVYFKYNTSYFEYEAYYRKNVFKDDKFLFINNFKLYNRLSDICNIIFIEEDYNEILNICKKYRNTIEEIYFKYGDMGLSMDIDFNNYLQEFQNYITLMYNIVLYALDESRDYKNKEYLIKLNMKELKSVLVKIESERGHWMEKLNITQDEFEQFEFQKDSVE